jgi:alkanesulfonate monooxygenase SsuD/methylene tetrahydromethanopterin reductase-like flavin-dependent oxidoreductase (luciferase family)
MNAGSSGEGRSYALRNCDAWFTNVRLADHREADLELAAKSVQEAKAEGRAHGHEIGVYTAGVVICRPTRKEAEEYRHYVGVENADWGAIDNTLVMKGLDKRSPEEVAHFRQSYAYGHGGLPLIGSPDDVAKGMADIAGAGFDGIAVSLVDYAEELPYFQSEVLGRLERLGLRKPPKN